MRTDGSLSDPNLVMSFAEQFDRNNFMQNILLGNMLIVDIYGKAKSTISRKCRVLFSSLIQEVKITMWQWNW